LTKLQPAIQQLTFMAHPVHVYAIRCTVMNSSHPLIHSLDQRQPTASGSKPGVRKLI